MRYDSIPIDSRGNKVYHLDNIDNFKQKKGDFDMRIAESEGSKAPIIISLRRLLGASAWVGKDVVLELWRSSKSAVGEQQISSREVSTMEGSHDFWCLGHQSVVSQSRFYRYLVHQV